MACLGVPHRNQGREQDGTSQLSESQRPIAKAFFEIAAAAGWEYTEGHYEAEAAQVIPDHKKLIRFEVGAASVSLGISATSWSHAMVTAFQYPRLNEINGQGRMRLAIDLYSESRALVIPRTQFLTLVIALEALLPRTRISDVAQEVLTELKKGGRDALTACGRDAFRREEINRLLSRVGGLSYEAIGTTLRGFVRSTAERHKDLGSPEELEARLKEIYDIRSSLVHEGAADEKGLEDGLFFLTRFVPRLLKILFVEAATAPRPA
jgi:hypothetical protein